MKTGLSTRTGISFSKSPGIKLNFDAQTGGFTSGNTITGATSGATATVLEEIGGETLTLTGITGTFEDNEIVYESALGAHILTGTDSDFSGAGNWTNYDCAVFDVNTTVAGKAYMLGDGSIDRMQRATTLEVDKFYYVTLKARLNAGASTELFAGRSSTISITFTPTGTEQTFTGLFLCTLSGILYIGGATGFNGIAFEIDDTTLQVVTNAALANGVVY